MPRKTVDPGIKICFSETFKTLEMFLLKNLKAKEMA